MRETLEKVNQQLKDPDLTIFGCLCNSKFLSLYETECLVQVLTQRQVDLHNNLMDQVGWGVLGVGPWSVGWKESWCGEALL